MILFAQAPIKRKYFKYQRIFQTATAKIKILTLKGTKSDVQEIYIVWSNMMPSTRKLCDILQFWGPGTANIIFGLGGAKRSIQGG